MASTLLYFMTITILSQNDRRLPTIVADIAKVLNDSTDDTEIVYKFKVVGEPKVIVVASAQDNAAIDRIVDKLWNVGKLEIISQPIIEYENFARNLGVSDNLTRPVANILNPKNLYWYNFRVDYNNKTTEELLVIWKSETEYILRARKNGDLRIIAYKNFAEREVQAFLNVPDPDQYDEDLFNFPLVQSIGSDVRTQTKGLQFLNNYICLSAGT